MVFARVGKHTKFCRYPTLTVTLTLTLTVTVTATLTLTLTLNLTLNFVDTDGMCTAGHIHMYS